MRRLRWRTILLAMALVASACQQSTTTGPAATGPAATAAATSAASSQPASQKLVYVYNLPPKGGWLLETDDAFVLTQGGIAEPLTRIDFDGNLKPSLATQWTQTSPTTWEFTLRDGVKFQDGSALDAAAVANALTHLLQVKVPARSFNAKSVSAVEAAGAKVKITTIAPSPLLPLLVATPNTAILAPRAYQGATVNPLGMGTGPFTMTKDDQPQSVTLKANPSYWGGAVGLKDVEIRFIPDINTRAALARSGEAQLVSPIGAASVPALKADPNLKIVQASVPRTTTLYVNNSKAPLSDARVRQAIQSAIDVKSIANDVLESTVLPAVGPFAPTAPFGPSGAQPVAYDLAKAQSLLAQAGTDPKTLTLSLWAYPERSDIPTVAVAIQAMLKKLGVTVEVRTANYNSLEADALAGKFDLFIISRGNLADINDPLNYLTADLSCKGTFNMAHFCSPTVDDQLAKAGTTVDTAARYAIYRDLAAQVQSQAVNVFLYHETQIDVQSVALQGYRIHPLHNYVLTAEMTLKAK